MMTETTKKVSVLNRSQKKFCNLPANKNVRLLAPAGSGKTYSLLWRCKYITEKAKENKESLPFFLLVAFTRSAKLELEYRLKHDKDFRGVRATVRTLNAWGWEQIKKPGKELITTRKQKQSIVNHDLLPLYKDNKKYSHIAKGFTTPYGRANNSVVLVDLMDLLKSLGFTHTMTKTQYKAHVKYLNEIGLLSNLEEGYEALYRLQGILNEDEKTREEGVWEFFDFWKKAVDYLEQVNRYTLEDQKYWARLYFQKQMEGAKMPKGITRYTHIMVDEFQDINPLDLELLRVATQYHSQNGSPVSLTIIGDDDQAIFGWRGTTPRFILQPDKYLGVKFTTCILDTNYRSPKNIVEISNQLLSYNREREPKEMKSAAKGKATVKVINSKGPGSTIEATMKLVRNLIKDERYQQIALIGRRHVSIFPYQVLMSAENIPYYVDADVDIYDGEAMQTLQNLLQIQYRSMNNDIDDPVEAVLVFCDKIDSFGIQKKERQSLYDFMDKKHPETMNDTIDALEKYPDTIKNMSISNVCMIIRKIIQSKTVFQFMEMTEKYLRGLDKDYRKKEIDTHYKEPQFFRLKEISKKYKDDFRSFYRDIERARKAGERSREKGKDDNESAYKSIVDTKIHLMTATRSKGHEYDAVIVLDVDDGEWPNHLTNDIEEERRLFYVAMSRARKYLCFVNSSDRLESRFLLEARLI